MNVDVFKTDNDLLSQIEMKKLIISGIVMILVSIQYFVNDQGGAIASWGSVSNVEVLFFQLPKGLFLFLMVFLGNFIILLSSFPLLNSETALFNKKMLQLVGFILFLYGVLGYFDFLFFEPFVLLYLCIIAILYYNISAFNLAFGSFSIQTPLFSQNDYSGYDVITKFSLWNPNTETFLGNYYANGTIDLVLLSIILLLLVQLGVLYSNEMRLIPESFVSDAQEFFKKTFTFYDNQKGKIQLTVAFLAFQYVLYTILMNNVKFYLSFLLLLILIPYMKRQTIRTELVKVSNLFSIRIYDLYMLNFIFLAIVTQLLGWIRDDMFYLIVFVFSLWLAIKIISVVSTFRSDNTVEGTSDILANISPKDIIQGTYTLISILYISAWLSGIDESFWFTIALFATLLYSAPFLIRNFFNAGVIKYSMRRIMLIIPMFIGISVVVFTIMSLSGNPIDLLISGTNCNHVASCVTARREFLMHYYGLDKPLQVQWFNWFFHFLQGDLGQEMSIGRNAVTFSVMSRVVPTLEITFIPTILAVLISIPLGIIASKKQNSLTDSAILIFVSIGIAVPIFFLIIVLILFFSVNLQLLPAGNRLLQGKDPSQVGYLYAQWFTKGIPIDYSLIFGGQSFFSIHTIIPINTIFDWIKWDWMWHMIIPVIAITILSLATYTRLIRAGMLEVMRNDYILSARASGFSEKTIINKYALRNVLLPVLTLLGLSLATVLAGAPITETVLNWPGLGLYSISAVLAFDYNPIMATSMVVAIMILFGNLLTDILYSVVDPRIRLD